MAVVARYHLDLTALVEDPRRPFCLTITPAKTTLQELCGREPDERAEVRHKVDAFLQAGGRFAEIEWRAGTG